MSNEHQIRSRIKQLIVDCLRFEGMSPADIADETPLFGEGLGLDSVDALELMVALEKEFRIKFQSHEVGRETLATVSSLASFVQGRVLAAEQGSAGA